MKLPQGWSTATPLFDDENLVSCAGLAPVMALAEQADLSPLLKERVRLDSVRTAGGADADALERVVFAASASDVTDVVSSGRRVVAGGEHQLLGDVGALLDRAVAAVL